MVSLRLSAVTVVSVCIFILFSACAINSNISKLSSEEKARMSRMLVFESEGLPRGSYQIIGTVESLSCKKSYNGYDEITKLKMQAAKLGADAIINLKFKTKNKMDWVHDCWATVIGIGYAVRIINTGAAPRKVVGKQKLP